MTGIVSVLSDYVCELGEGPSYDEATGSLYWFNIVHGQLLERSRSGATKAHQLGQMASALAVVDDKRQLVFAETGLHLRDTATGKLTLHTPIEADNKGTRSNDARVHPCGAFWLGTMSKTHEKKAGAIYWFFKGELRKLYDGITVPNSIAFSEDGTVAYYVDSDEKLLMRVDCDPANGLPLGEPKLFGDHRQNAGYVDGSVVDRDGILWNACWGASAVNAYAPDGKLVRSIPMPVTQPSCPAFVGASADRLAVTSAWADQDEAQRAADPDAGKTFVIDFPVRGRFEPRVLI
ncbi:L-arabinolactonase [Mycolicibacterium aubagnense]